MECPHEREEKKILREKRLLEYAEACGNVLKTCRHFGVSRSNFYIWRAAYRRQGNAGLVRKKPIARSHPNQTPAEVVEKVLYLRQKYHLGPIRIVWYMRRYHDIRISDAGVYRVLRRNGLSRLPRKAGTRAVHTKRYEKQVPGHHIQVDVKFLIFKGKGGDVIKRYQYTAIDDATRIRALKVCSRHNQANAIDFVEYVVDATSPAGACQRCHSLVNARADERGACRFRGRRQAVCHRATVWDFASCG